MVVANNPTAEASGFEQGTAMLAGGRVGPGTVDLIGCVGRIEAITTEGQDIVRHGSRSGIPPALRRAVLARDNGCTIDACTSVDRLEVHHIVPRFRGGDNSPQNLTTLCWWHHHVAIHRQGKRIDPNPHPDSYYPPTAAAATNHPTPTPTHWPSSAPSTHPPSEPLPNPQQPPLPDERPVASRRGHRKHGDAGGSIKQSGCWVADVLPYAGRKRAGVVRTALAPWVIYE